MPGDNTVAIVAIGATAFVGVAGPTIAAVFDRARQRREHNHARELDDLAERRRVIFGAFDQLNQFDWATRAPGRREEPEAMIEAGVQFGMALSRLQAVLGLDSDFAVKYEKVTATLVVALRLESEGDNESADRARGDLNERRRELVRAARPFLIATTHRTG
jgi:hypothetical protein